jgi:hypothetical protein
MGETKSCSQSQYLCYTQFMQAPRANWPGWAERLQYWKLDSFAAWLLEAAGPFALLSAQVLYFFRPFLPARQIGFIAMMLEEDEEVKAFVEYLREGKSA